MKYFLSPLPMLLALVSCSGEPEFVGNWSQRTGVLLQISKGNSGYVATQTMFKDGTTISSADYIISVIDSENFEMTAVDENGWSGTNKARMNPDNPKDSLIVGDFLLYDRITNEMASRILKNGGG